MSDDANRNARADAADPGLAGATVYLDANGNGVRDLGELSVTSRFVASDGTADRPAAEGRILVAASPVDFRQLSVTADAPGGLAVGRPATVNWTVRNAGPGTTVASGGADGSDEV